MKNEKVKFIAIGCLSLLSLCIYLAAISVHADSNEHELSFKAKSNSETFVVGEPIEIEFEFFNSTNNAVIIPSGGVETGSLKVFVAKQNDEFKEYFAYDWGRKKGTRKALEPNQSYGYKATLLWNGMPNVSHLSQEAAKQVLKGKITTEYALPEPGVYLIKGVSYIGENATPIESEEVEVVVNAPEGDDLTVWNQIKGKRDIAILMQTGDFANSKDEDKNISEVEHIILQYPNSIYSKYLKPNLEKFKENKAKRIEFLRHAMRP